jgi:hypothetical protein
MPQELIYTSAVRSLIAGRSGYGPVARSREMREALILELEKLSYYQHLSLSGGQERPIYCCRIVDIRGSRYHVLSKIQDAGLDFTGRTNFIAHYLVFRPEEVRQYPSPPVILRCWPGWLANWFKEPELIDERDRPELRGLPGISLPAKEWERLTEKHVIAQYWTSAGWQTGLLSNSVPKTARMMIGLAICSESSTNKIKGEFAGVSER